MRLHSFALALIGSMTLAGAADPPKDLEQVQTISLGAVDGRIDHMAVDLGGGRLFVSALGNDSVEVVDLRAGSVTFSLKGLLEPQGVFYDETAEALFVSTAGEGRLNVFEGRDLLLRKRIDFGGDVDNIHPDPQTAGLWVSAGSALALIDRRSLERGASIDLPGHPEGFALQRNVPRIFVNVPQPKSLVVVVDRNLGRVVSTWNIGGPRSPTVSNFPIALDETDQRLFIGTRYPAALEVLDSESGHLVGELSLDEDPDDIFYDAPGRRVFVTCGAGFIDEFAQENADRYIRVARIPTAPGARTSLWVPELRRLFVAVPAGLRQKAEIRVFAAK